MFSRDVYEVFQVRTCAEYLRTAFFGEHNQRLGAVLRKKRTQIDTIIMNDDKIFKNIFVSMTPIIF